MTAAVITVATIAIIALVVWVAAPMFGNRRKIAGSTDAELDALIEIKLQVYRAILDLESDRAVDKVSAEDEAVMRRQLETEALKILREVERLDPHLTIDSLEQEIAAVRERLRSET